MYDELLVAMGINDNDKFKKSLAFLIKSNPDIICHSSKNSKNKWDLYKTKQRFTTPNDEGDIPDISYASQKDHAIDWFISQAFWTKKKGLKVDVNRLISKLQCPTLILYLSVITECIDKNKIDDVINYIHDKFPEKDKTARNARFEEKTLLIEYYNLNISKNNLIDDITEKLN